MRNPVLRLGAVAAVGAFVLMGAQSCGKTAISSGSSGVGVTGNGAAVVSIPHSQTGAGTWVHEHKKWAWYTLGALAAAAAGEAAGRVTSNGSHLTAVPADPCMNKPPDHTVASWFPPARKMTLANGRRQVIPTNFNPKLDCKLFNWIRQHASKLRHNYIPTPAQILNCIAAVLQWGAPEIVHGEIAWNQHGDWVNVNAWSTEEPAGRIVSMTPAEWTKEGWINCGK